MNGNFTSSFLVTGLFTGAGAGADTGAGGVSGSSSSLLNNTYTVTNRCRISRS